MLETDLCEVFGDGLGRLVLVLRHGDEVDERVRVRRVLDTQDRKRDRQPNHIRPSIDKTSGRWLIRPHKTSKPSSIGPDKTKTERRTVKGTYRLDGVHECLLRLIILALVDVRHRQACARRQKRRKRKQEEQPRHVSDA